jgi:hypothetical protein
MVGGIHNNESPAPRVAGYGWTYNNVRLIKQIGLSVIMHQVIPA